jgi:hypothetical protein
MKQLISVFLLFLFVHAALGEQLLNKANSSLQTVFVSQDPFSVINPVFGFDKVPHFRMNPMPIRLTHKNDTSTTGFPDTNLESLKITGLPLFLFLHSLELYD